MNLLVTKVLCLVGVFGLMLGGSLLPVRFIATDGEKAERSQRIISICNSFGGGVFLGTIFNALLPAVREKGCLDPVRFPLNPAFKVMKRTAGRPYFHRRIEREILAASNGQGCGPT